MEKEDYSIIEMDGRVYIQCRTKELGDVLLLNSKGLDPIEFICLGEAVVYLNSYFIRNGIK